MTEVSRILLAQNTSSDLLKPEKMPNDFLLLMGAVAFLTLLFLVWAVFIRKRKQDLADWRLQESRHSSSHHSDGSGHRRRRRRRREHRPRNPTLAETGGLPPARTEPPQAPAS